MGVALSLATTPVPACPVCGTAGGDVLHDGLDDGVFAVAPGPWTMRRCPGCGAARLDPRPADEALAATYDTDYYTHGAPQPNIDPQGTLPQLLRALRNGYVNARLGYALAPAASIGALLGRLLAPLGAIFERPVRSLPLGGRILDVGCGNGLFVAEAAASGWRASGIDLDAPAVDAGREAGLDLAVETLADRAAREPGAYDAVTMSHVIEHVADPVGFLGQARELLRDGGQIWLATPNRASTSAREFGASWIGLDPPRHLVVFERASLARALERAGFTDIRFLRPTPAAEWVHYRISAGTRAGVRPSIGAPNASLRVRVLALLQELRDQLRPVEGSELLVLARRAG